ncbi:MAG: hypothetical protein EKK54_12050 [Neisseriaceae bacterium]|nr:MAG: hypothetical protein EKK54_12050 [Neisseriaceae bacterium]
MKNKLGSSLVAGLILSSAILAACSNGTNSSAGSNSTPNSTIDTQTLVGLTYDSVTDSVFSVGQGGALCKISVKNIPGNMTCNLYAPDNILVTSQITDPNKGNIYALGTQAQTGNDYLLTYHTKDNTWAVAKIDVPFTMAFNNLKYYAGNLYLVDQNESALYTIKLDSNKFESVPNFSVPGGGDLMTIDDSGADSGTVFYTARINSTDSNFTTATTSQTYYKKLGSSAPWVKYGPSDRNISDGMYVKGTLYGCAESDFVYTPYHPTGVDDNFSWKVYTSAATPGYFSCDYMASDGNNLYYVEGKWASNEKFYNNFVNILKTN